MQAPHEPQASLEPQTVNLDGVAQNPPTMLELKFIMPRMENRRCSGTST